LTFNFQYFFQDKRQDNLNIIANVELDRDSDMINKNVILYLTNVIGFLSHITKSLQKPWHKRRSLEATFITSETFVITPIKRRIDLLPSC